MTISAAIALIIAVLLGHHSPFLFSIGLFSLYLLITENRALSFKKKVDRVRLDIIGNISMLVIAICMVLVPLIMHRGLNIVLLVFGLLGILAALNTFRLLRKKTHYKNDGYECI
jgi:O-antigen/teichoic acid export membrane protein